jgi:hypothetical protein
MDWRSYVEIWTRTLGELAIELSLNMPQFQFLNKMAVREYCP